MSGKNEFERAGDIKPPGIVREFLEFLATNKKWWLLPILISLLALGSLVVATNTGLAPWIYSFF